jgi:RAQPRD family integrative conjugative element protein
MPTTVFLCLILPLAIVDVSNNAAFARERDQLSLVQQQFDTLERLATQAEAASTAEPDDRYRFDYPRLSQDIQRIRQGVQCSGLMKPDTHLGENARHREVSDDQATPYLYPRIQT